MSDDNQEFMETTAEDSAMPQAQGPQLALNDLTAAIQIIDVAASRGAFRGEELSQVGGVRDRLSVFLNANLPPQEEGTEAEAEGDEESDEPRDDESEETD